MSDPTPRPPLPVYLGPTLPRWQPTTLVDVQAAIDDGTLTERHWLDVKASSGSSDGAKKETARDLASFANDGGGLLIGVAEDKATGALSLAPVQLAGAAEQLDQIARSRCDPPLFVVCHPLRDPADSAQGVLLIEIPPSPSAPHMVDGRYYERGDTTKAPMADTTVARLHGLRSSRRLTAEQLVDREVARDPVPVDLRKHSHVHVVAQPLASPPDLLTALMESPGELHQRVVRVMKAAPRSLGVEPNSDWLGENEPRATGIGFRSYGLAGRQFALDVDDAREDGLFDLEIDDNGRVTLFSGRGSRGLKGTDPPDQLLCETAVVGHVRAVVEVAADLASTTGYGGQWILAVGLTDTLGRASMTSRGNALGYGYSYFSADRYVEGTEASTAELLQCPGQVTRRLVRRLLRALNTIDLSWHTSMLADRH